VQEHQVFVSKPMAFRRNTPVRRETLILIDADFDIRVANVDREQHRSPVLHSLHYAIL